MFLFLTRLRALFLGAQAAVSTASSISAYIRRVLDPSYDHDALVTSASIIAQSQARLIIGLPRGFALSISLIRLGALDPAVGVWAYTLRPSNMAPRFSGNAMDDVFGALDESLFPDPTGRFQAGSSLLELHHAVTNGATLTFSNFKTN